MKLRIVLADDDYLVRAGVAALLEQVDGLDVVAVAADLPELIALAAQHRPDVVLTDIRMPPDHRDEGVQAARRIRAEQPGTGVLVLSQHAEPAYARDLMAGGAGGTGYLLKERVTHLGELALALESVARGGSVLDPKVVEVLLEGHSSSPLDRLSPREREVLAEMAQGKSNNRIAADLHVTVRAVEKHINAVFAKLGLAEESTISRRVMAVLTFLDEAR
ncbi:response regulator transcription factor [Spirillospora sp. CA-294931]|uniref:response regulator transcription factor n=1 Tax=Spirillospora sp. CA-294931 TaxID=3240042 RepID=UPI003D8F927A